MNQRIVFLFTAVALACGPASTALAQAPTDKVEIVAVAGCLQEQGTGNWMLVSATDPVPSTANAPPAKAAPSNASSVAPRAANASPQTAPPATPPARTAAPDVPTTTSGKNQFKLIGVSEFNLPSYKGQTVLVKALHVKAMPVSRLNITSVTTLAPSCGPVPK